MPIVCSRKTGEVKTAGMTAEQNNKAWEIILREYIKRHPDVLEEKPEGDTQ